jgi:hypothetical protein
MDLKAFYAGIEAWRNVPFHWETANCCHFCADMLFRTTGRVIEIPSLADEKDMQRWLKEHGHQSLYHCVVSHLGKSVKPLLARRGDIVYRSDDGAFGVVDRQGLFLSDRGLVAFPLSRCNRAFRV